MPPHAIQITTDSAERDITVYFDPQIPFAYEDISAILKSKQFASEAIGEVTGKVPGQLVPEQAGAGGGFEWRGWKASPYNIYRAYVTGRRDLIHGSDHSLPLRLQVEVTQLEDADSKIKAEKYAELVIKHLNKVLADLSRRSLEQQLGQLRTAADEARRKVQVAEIKVEELSMRLRNLSGALPEASLHELVSDLTKQQQALEVELAGMTGRREALQREVAKSSERLKKSSADNDVVRNLKRVVELRKEQLAQVKELYRQGVAGGGPGMVAKAEEQVVLAEIELAQAIQATARPTDAHLEKLNDELSQVAVSIAENEAKLPFLKDRLNEYEGTLAAAAQTKALREQLDYEIRELSSARLSADAAKRNVAELESSFRPARVEVFELTPKDEKGADTDKVKRQ
jgi:DNA repair exonuclease SbcCD ATPase subunit